MIRTVLNTLSNLERIIKDYTIHSNIFCKAKCDVERTHTHNMILVSVNFENNFFFLDDDMRFYAIDDLDILHRNYTIGKCLDYDQQISYLENRMKCTPYIDNNYFNNHTMDLLKREYRDQYVKLLYHHYFVILIKEIVFNFVVSMHDQIIHYYIDEETTIDMAELSLTISMLLSQLDLSIEICAGEKFSDVLKETIPVRILYSDTSGWEMIRTPHSLISMNYIEDDMKGVSEK